MSSGRQGRFHLLKYYLDCVAPDGSAFIAYAARLRWGPLFLHYTAVHESDARGRRRDRHSWSRAPAPVATGGGFGWRCPGLGISAAWRDATPGYEVSLLADGAARVEWRVLAPRAAATIEGPDGGVEGPGYIERLELTLEPWLLPLDTLHWGRFHSGAGTLVWLGWDGEHPLRDVRYDGRVLPDAGFVSDGLELGSEGELRFTDSQVLRDAPVVAAVAKLPRVLRLLPPAFMKAREVKWLSRARLSLAGLPPESGWALHEQVGLR